MSSNRGETRPTHASTVSHHPHHRQSLGTGLGEMHQQRRSHRDDQKNLAGSVFYPNPVADLFLSSIRTKIFKFERNKLHHYCWWLDTYFFKTCDVFCG